MNEFLGKIHVVNSATAVGTLSVIVSLLFAVYLLFRYKKLSTRIFDCIDSYAPHVIEKYGGTRTSFPLTKFACFGDRSMPFQHGYSFLLFGNIGISEQFQTISELRQMLDQDCVAYLLLQEAHACLHYSLVSVLLGGTAVAFSMVFAIIF